MKLRQRRLVARDVRWAGVLAFTLWGCNNPGAGSELTVLGTTSLGGGATVGSQPPDPYLVGYDALLPEGAGDLTTGGAAPVGQGGEAGQMYPPANAVSLRCGDRIFGKDQNGYQEECDDGDEGSDACAAECQTRDQPILPSSSGVPEARRSHYLGVGRHPVAAGDDGFVVSFIDTTDQTPGVSASIYNRYGQRQKTGLVSVGANPVVDANPVVAELPGGAYAIAWTDFDGDGSDLGIALRRINAEHQLGALSFANAEREFSQRDADLIWDGTQLVAAWVDFSDAATGPDIRLRTFDADLRPTSGDVSLADSALPEANVALAKVAGGWCAAYREGSPDGAEYLVVKSSGNVTRVGPLLGGPITDRPALVELDETHVLVAFSEGRSAAEGPANFARLSYAVVDRTQSVTLTPQALAPLDGLWTRSPAASQFSPAAASGADGVYLAWRSEALPGDAAGDQLWLKYLGWAAPASGGPKSLRVSETELLLPRTCEESVGDQRLPALAATSLPPHGGLAVAWEDYGGTQGAHSGKPEVAVHFAPTNPRGSAQLDAEYLEERWDGADGSAWNGRWTSEGGTFQIITQRGAGQVSPIVSSAPFVSYVNDRTALNVDLVTSVRLTAASRAGLVTRRTDADPTSYLAFQFGSWGNEPWRTYAMLDGVRTDIEVLPPLNNVPVRAAELAYRMRFRTVTQADGSLFVAARVWPDALPEPEAWLFETTLPVDSIIAQRLGGPGRFGLQAWPRNTNTRATFDDFQAKFFNGAQIGDLDAVAATWPLPLTRSLAHYRRCQPGQPCEEAGGCCETSADCAAGAACGSHLSINVPLGSHADACVVDHCANGMRDADEERTDCGGASCAPCTCAVTASTGTSAYCPTTCPCGTGDAACIQDSQCVAGRSCSSSSGSKYGWPAGTGVCTPFHCVNASLDLGETWPDCGGECGSCAPVEVTPSGGAIDATAGPLQKILAAAPLTITSVTGLAKGQTLCLVTDSSEVTLGALPFNRVHDYTLLPGVSACFVVDTDLLLQSTNLPDETLTSLNEVANLDWHLSNEPSQFQLNGTNISRWLASVGGTVHDAAQATASLQPAYSGAGALMGSSRYLVGGGTNADWTFLQRPGTLFMVLRPDTQTTGYLLGTVHDSSASAGSGFGIYFDASTFPPRARFRVGNGSASYAFALHTTRSFPLDEKTILAATLSDTKLEAFKVYDSIGSVASTGALSTAAPYSVALVGARPSSAKSPFPGAIFEILHYGGAMSQRARQAITRFLLEKHGIR